jgi:hypothetical protein
VGLDFLYRGILTGLTNDLLSAMVARNPRFAQSLPADSEAQHAPHTGTDKTAGSTARRMNGLA